ncbi:hypothetical protein ACPC54_16380 [Kitasatospora sp. NPDC094028]
MRRAAALCLLVTTAAALAGCASGTPAGSPAAAPSAAASSAAPAAAPTTAPTAAPAAAASPSAGASAAASAGASADPVQAWALQSSQFSTVSSAVLPMTTAIMTSHGDPATVGKACTALAGKVNGAQPEAGAPAEWAKVIAGLQKATEHCDAVTAGDSGAYDRMQSDFDTAMTHLKPIIDRI